MLRIALEALIKTVGSVAFRKAVTDATKELVIKHGRGQVIAFLKKISAEEIKDLSKDQIIALFEQQMKQGAKVAFDKTVFSKSNAKALADVINKSINFIDEKTKSYAIKRLARIRQKEFVEMMAQNMNVPRDLGRGTFEVLGGEVPGFGFLSATPPGKIAGQLRDITRWGLETALFPLTKGQAFTSGYVRGIIGGTTVGAIESAISTLPRQALMSPTYRRFFRSMAAELELFKSYKMAGVSTAEQLYNSIRLSYRAAKAIGVSESFAKETIAGQIAGRLTVPIASTYVFVDKDERKQRMENFKRSVPEFAKKQTRTWVDAHVRKDGTRVKGHYRRLEVA